MTKVILKTIIVCLFCASGSVAWSQTTTLDRQEPAEQIKTAVKSYVVAFNQRDADGLAAHWSPEGVYISRTTGEQVVGREAMVAEFKAMFSESDVPTLAVTTESIEFISPNVALERGVSAVTMAEDEVSESRYSVVYVRRDGSWLIDRVTEDETPVETSHYEHLQALEPLIGEWTYEGDEVTVEVACNWTKNRNYISRTYKIVNREQEGIESSGLQIIGWDASVKSIRSWLFDSDGGLVRGTWTERDGKWVVSSVATLADGSTGSFSTLLRPLDDGNLAWQKINQVVDGELLPNIDEIIFARK